MYYFIHQLVGAPVAVFAPWVEEDIVSAGIELAGHVQVGVVSLQGEEVQPAKLTLSLT